MRTLASQGAAPSELRALAFEEYMQAVHPDQVEAFTREVAEAAGGWKGWKPLLTGLLRDGKLKQADLEKQAVHAFRLAFGGVPQIGDGEIAAAVKRKLGNRRYEVAKEKVGLRAD